MSAQLTTENVEVAALTAPGKPLTGKLQAQTSIRAEFRDPGQIADALVTDTRFSVRDAVVLGIDLQKAVQTVGLSRGGITNLDMLAGQVHTRGKAAQLTNLVASSGALSATGNVAISASKNLNGRISVDMSNTHGALGMPLIVGGTLDAPERHAHARRDGGRRPRHAGDAGRRHGGRCGHRRPHRPGPARAVRGQIGAGAWRDRQQRPTTAGGASRSVADEALASMGYLPWSTACTCRRSKRFSSTRSTPLRTSASTSRPRTGRRRRS